MNSYTKYLGKKSIFLIISILSIMALMPFVYSFLPIIDFIVLGSLDRSQNVVVATPNIPNLASTLLMSLFFNSFLWVFAIWKMVVPQCKIGLFPACLGLLFIIFGVLFAYYVYLPLVFNLIVPVGIEASLSLSMLRDFTVKSLVSFILMFQIFPVTLHFRKNYSRSFLYSILIRGLLLIASVLLASLIAPPDILSQLAIILPVIILFESARGIRRYVVLEHGQFHKTDGL